MEKIKIKVERIPVSCFYSFFMRRKMIYVLPDNSYGEWLIEKEDIPFYYLNLFDKEYADMDVSFRQYNGEMEDFMREILLYNKIDYLKIGKRPNGFEHIEKSEIVELEIDKFPIILFERFKNKS